MCVILKNALIVLWDEATIAHSLSTIVAMERQIVLDGESTTLKQGTHAQGVVYARLWAQQSSGSMSEK